MSSIEEVCSSLSQINNGPGDNIGRDKVTNIYHSIAPETLRSSIQLILTSIRDRKNDRAKIQLETIKATSSLNSEALAVLNMLSIHLNLLEDEEKTKAYSSLVSFFNISTDKLVNDLCLATLIRLDVEKKRIDDARERYQKNFSGSYSQEVFYELIATSEELENIYEQSRVSLGESELNGIIRGSFRTENFVLSSKVAERLNEIFPSFNSQILKLYAEAIILFNITLKGRHLWIVTATLKTEIIDITKKLIVLIKELKDTDLRLFNIAIPCLYYSTEQHQELSDICWKYINEVEKVDLRMAAVLYQTYAKDFSKFENEFERRHAKAQHDEEYRCQLLNEIFSLKDISIEDFIVLKGFSDKNRIIQWVKSGCTVSGKDNLETDFAILQLGLVTLPNKKNKTEIEKLRLQTEVVIQKYKEKLAILNPLILEELTSDLLLNPEISFEVSKLIEPILPTSDLWASPLVKNYLNALLESDQMETLEKVLNLINKDNWDSFVWQIQARLFERHSNEIQAINSIEEALKLKSHSLDSWCFLIHLHRRLNTSDEEMFSILQRVPDEILSIKSKMGLSLLTDIAKTGDFNRAEKIILSWFIENPNVCAKALSDFHFGITLENNCDLTGSEKVGDCIVGVRFRKDNEETLKLLIDFSSPNHHCLLDVNSPLGSMLHSMKIGEVKAYGVHDYELMERLPSYIAAFRISLELRQIQNDGSDCFFSFQVPDNPDEMLMVMEDKLSRIQNQHKDDEIINNSSIPLICKGHFLHKNDPMKAALILLSTKNGLQHSLPNIGENSPEIAVLDIYTIAYLALSGLAFGINKIPTKFIITNETKLFIDHWLKDINSEDYMTLSVRPEGGLLRVTADDIKQSTQHRQIKDAFKIILSECEIITPKLVDIPSQIVQIQDFVDYSVYSSLKLSMSQDIPWLCIDANFAYLFSTSGGKVVNAFELLAELGGKLNFEQKKEGLYLHALGILPYPLLFQDLTLLALSNDKHAHYYLAETIFLYPKAFKNTNIAIDFLSTLLIPVLEKALLDGQFAKGLRIHNPSNNGYAERVFNACCYVSMQCNDGKSEVALPMLLCKLFSEFSIVSHSIKLICAMATEFAKGHFLDIPTINKNIKALSGYKEGNK